MPSPLRVEITEEEPLLPAPSTADPVKPRPWWSFWSVERRFEDEDDDYISEGERRSLWKKLRNRKRTLATEVMLGLLLLGIGAAVGAIVDHTIVVPHDQKQGPLVPPVFKLPPVCPSPMLERAG